MGQISSQTLLTTVRSPIDVGHGGGGLLYISNYTGGAVIAKVYVVPIINESSTITDHLLWIASCPANSTISFSEHCPIYCGQKFRLEAEAASNTALVLSVIAQTVRTRMV